MTHSYSNKRIHFLANVISKNWLILAAAHLWNKTQGSLDQVETVLSLVVKTQTTFLTNQVYTKTNHDLATWVSRA